MLSRKKKRVHSNNKSWITPHVKNLIAKRQIAFISGNDQEWRKLRNGVKYEMELAKTKYHAFRIQGIQNTEPRKWYQQTKKVTNYSRSELRLGIPGVKEDDEKGKADAVNNKFTKVSTHVPPLNVANVPVYLPSKDPVPQIYTWDVYSELKNLTKFLAKLSRSLHMD